MLQYVLIGAVLLIGIAMFMNRSRQESFRNISVQELRELMKQKDVILIDVRTKKEIAQGVIGNPLEIELGPSMNRQFEGLDKDKTYVIYCRSGRRSAMASGVMSRMGFQNVNNLQGGIMAWKA